MQVLVDGPAGKGVVICPQPGSPAPPQLQYPLRNPQMYPGYVPPAPVQVAPLRGPAEPAEATKDRPTGLSTAIAPARSQRAVQAMTEAGLRAADARARRDERARGRAERALRQATRDAEEQRQEALREKRRLAQEEIKRQREQRRAQEEINRQKRIRTQRELAARQEAKVRSQARAQKSAVREIASAVDATRDLNIPLEKKTRLLSNLAAATEDLRPGLRVLTSPPPPPPLTPDQQKRTQEDIIKKLAEALPDVRRQGREFTKTRQRETLKDIAAQIQVPAKKGLVLTPQEGAVLADRIQETAEDMLMDVRQGVRASRPPPRVPTGAPAAAPEPLPAEAPPALLPEDMTPQQIAEHQPFGPIIRDKLTGQIDWTAMTSGHEFLQRRLPSGVTTEQFMDEWVQSIMDEQLREHAFDPSRIVEGDLGDEKLDDASPVDAEAEKRRIQQLQDPTQEIPPGSESMDPCDEILAALADLSTNPNNQAKRKRVADLMRTLAGATMAHFSLGASWLDKANRLENNQFTINDTSIKELWDEAIEICGVVERVASRTGMTISDIMEQGKKAGHRRAVHKETVDKSEGLVKPKGPVFDPRIKPFAEMPRKKRPRINPGIQPNVPIPLAARVGATPAQRTKPGRDVAQDQYQLLHARLESFTSDSLREPGLRADYIKYLGEANQLAEQYDFPVVISKLGAGKDLRKDTGKIALEVNTVHSKANKILNAQIKKDHKKATGVKKTIDKKLKGASKKNDAVQAKLRKANANNRKREAGGLKRKPLGKLTTLAAATQKALDDIINDKAANQLLLDNLGAQAQASKATGKQLKEQAQDIKHDIKMSDREMDLSDARVRRLDMSDPIGKHMIRSLDAPDMGPTMEEDLGIRQRTKAQKRKTTPKDPLKPVKPGKRTRVGKSAKDIAEEKIQEDADRRKQQEAIAGEKVEAEFKYKEKRAEAREWGRIKGMMEKSGKLEKWAATEWEMDFGLRFAPTQQSFNKSLAKAQKVPRVTEKEAKKKTASEWRALTKKADQDALDTKNSGIIAADAYGKVIPTPKKIPRKQKQVLLDDLEPFAEKKTLPARIRAKLAMTFVPAMKKKYPGVGWKTFNPDKDKDFDTQTSIEMRQLLGRANEDLATTSAQTDLLLLKIMGYPREVQENIRATINAVSRELGGWQQKFIDKTYIAEKYRSALEIREKVDKKDAKKSKVQKLRRREREQSAPRDRSPSPQPRAPRAKTPTKPREKPTDDSPTRVRTRSKSRDRGRERTKSPEPQERGRKGRKGPKERRIQI